jgi:hypothetical protein
MLFDELKTFRLEILPSFGKLSVAKLSFLVPSRIYSLHFQKSKTNFHYSKHYKFLGFQRISKFLSFKISKYSTVKFITFFEINLLKYHFRKF